MTGRDPADAGQLGFDVLLKGADAENRAQRFERETGHLPATMGEALPFYRALIDRHHAAMLSADVNEAMRLREQAHKLALRLNGGAPGILAGPGAPGCVLERETAAAPGAVPLWGQTGEFIIAVHDMRVRVALHGMFGICARTCYWPGFAAHAVDHDRPFLSETGYRSFLGIHAEAQPGLTPDAFVHEVIAVHVEGELKGRLLAIEARYRDTGAS